MLGIKPGQTAGDGRDAGWIGPAPEIRTALPGPAAKALIDRDEALSSPSYTRDYPLAVRRASGSVVEDVDGNRFLDFAAGIAVCATGHCHPRVVEAVERQARSLIHICGSDFYYGPMADLMAKLSALVPPADEPKRVFLCNSGTEAVEAAIKLSRYHTKKKWLISFHGAFHGRTIGSLSLTCSKGIQQARFGPLMPMVAHAPYGDADAIEQTLFRYKVPSDEVAAVFVEAVQGEGGYVVPEAGFLPQLRDLCDRHGILLVLDEIQSGMGRTGKWFAFEHFGIQPDIVLMAKGLASGMPLGAVIARADIMSWPPSAHASTFGGNPVCCAAALATIDVVTSSLLANAESLGRDLMVGLRAIADSRKFITKPRGLGLMCAVDIVGKRSGKPDQKFRNRILQSVFERGLILLGCGESSIRFCPPLCMNKTQLDVGLKLFDEVAGAVA